MPDTEWLTRKLGAICARRGCRRRPLDDNCLCAEHAAEHRAANRRWKRYGMVQLRLDIGR